MGPRRYAHSVGIILRDIKPRNLMIDAAASGVVKLTGSACRRSAAHPNQTPAPRAPGTSPGRARAPAPPP